MTILDDAVAFLNAYTADYAEAARKVGTGEELSEAYKALLGHEERLLKVAAELESAPLDASPESIDKMRDIGSSVAVIHKFDMEMTDAAVKFFGADEPTESGTDSGASAIVDRLLPQDWDFSRDLVSVAGPVHPRVWDKLWEMGQRRAIALREEGVPFYPDWVVVVDKPEDVVEAVREFVEPHPQNISSLTEGMGPAHAGNGPKYSLFHQNCHKSIQHLISMNKTIEDLGETWILHGVQNLPGLSEDLSINAIGDVFRDKPMVMCGAGPSLTENIEHLRKLKGKALLVAFSQSAKAMWAAGVIPDLVIVVDPSDLSYHFEGCDVSQASGLVLGVTCHPNLFKLPFKRRFYYAGNSQLENWITSAFNESCALPAAGTVAHSTYSLAGFLRANPLILVGMDLSFPGGKMYAHGSADDGARVQFEKGSVGVTGHRFEWPKVGVFEVPAWFGGRVKTSALYYQFLGWFEDQFSRVNEHVRIINCTEGGAFIKGAEHLRLKDVTSLYAFQPLDAENLISDIVAKADFSDRNQKVKEHLLELQRRVQGTERAALMVVEAVDKYRKTRAAADREQFIKMESELIDHLDGIAFLSLMHQAKLKDITKRYNQAANKEEFLLKSGDETALLVLDAIHKIKGLLADSVQVATKRDASSFVSSLAGSLAGLQL